MIFDCLTGLSSEQIVHYEVQDLGKMIFIQKILLIH